MLFPAFNNARKIYFLIVAFRQTTHTYSVAHTTYLCHDVKMCKHLVQRKCNLEVVYVLWFIKSEMAPFICVHCPCHQNDKCLVNVLSALNIHNMPRTAVQISVTSPEQNESASLGLREQFIIDCLRRCLFEVTWHSDMSIQIFIGVSFYSLHF